MLANRIVFLNFQGEDLDWNVLDRTQQRKDSLQFMGPGKYLEV